MAARTAARGPTSGSSRGHRTAHPAGRARGPSPPADDEGAAAGRQRAHRAGRRGPLPAGRPHRRGVRLDDPAAADRGPPRRRVRGRVPAGGAVAVRAGLGAQPRRRAHHLRVRRARPGGVVIGQQAALVVVTRDDEVREQMAAELHRRYDREYAIVAAADAAGVREGLAESGRPVAVLFGGLGDADPDGLARLRNLHADHPGALAVALVRWGAWETARPIFDALAVGQLDRWLTAPEGPGDEEFHRAVTEFLDEWATRRGGGFEAVRIIGDRWSERAQHLRDTLTRNRIPIGFYEAGSPGGNALLAGVGLGRPRPAGGGLRLRPGRTPLPGPRDLHIAHA